MQQIFEINIFRERNTKSRATLMDLEVKMEQVSLQLKDLGITIRSSRWNFRVENTTTKAQLK